MKSLERHIAKLHKILSLFWRVFMFSPFLWRLWPPWKQCTKKCVFTKRTLVRVNRRAPKWLFQIKGKKNKRNVYVMKIDYFGTLLGYLQQPRLEFDGWRALLDAFYPSNKGKYIITLGEKGLGFKNTLTQEILDKFPHCKLRQHHEFLQGRHLVPS